MRQTRTLLIVVLAAALLGGAGFFMFRSNPAPAIALVDAPTGAAGDGAPVVASEAASPRGTAGDAAITRRAVTTADAPKAADPDYTAALGGYAGRVVDHARAPVADSKVQLFRLDPSVVMTPTVTPMSETTMQLSAADAGETVTDAEGRFLLPGVWPHAMFLLKAGVGSDCPTFKVVDQSVGPGEVVDLGDVVLKDAAIAVGRVVDAETGQPVAGALVRVADIPGTILQLVPIERFDPEGYVSVLDEGGHMLFKMPSWVSQRYAQLPIASALTGEDGAFRVAGCDPGVNVVVVTKFGYQSAVRQSVKLEAGETRDLGKLTLGTGTTAEGRVVDTNGKPIAGAEILCGSKAMAAPVAFLQAAGESDERGEFSCSGMSPGEVVAGARRGPGDAWTLTVPQAVQREIVVRLPAQHSLTVGIKSAAGLAIEVPSFKLLPRGVPSSRDIVTMGMVGVVPPVPLTGRLSRLEDGRYRLAGLNAGKYVLLVQSPGHAVSSSDIDLQGDLEHSVMLEREAAFEVVVVDADGKPIRRATIVAEPAGDSKRRIHEIPLNCGETDAEGRLRVTALQGERANVSASHPRYGVASGSVKLPAAQPLVIRMDVPGGIEGVVTDNRKPPLPGKWSVVVHGSPTAGVHGPLEGTPRFAALDLEGKFKVSGVRPGDYAVSVAEMNQIQTIGSFFKTMMFLSRTGDRSERRVSVVSGKVSRVDIETAEEAPVEGPSARLAGTVTINGLPARGMMMSASGQRRIAREIDAGGSFDFGPVPAGHVHLELFDPKGFDENPEPSELWARNLQVKAGEDQLLRIDLTMSSVAGVVVNADGTPCPGVHVRLRGRDAPHAKDTITDVGHVSQGTMTDAKGAFDFPRVPAGRFSLVARARGTDGRGSLDVHVSQGTPATGLRVTLGRTYRVAGTVDKKRLPGAEGWMWLNFSLEPDPGASDHVPISEGTGVEEGERFEMRGLPAGRYRVRIHANGVRGRWEHDGLIEVTRDLEAVVIAPVEIKETPAPQRAEPGRKR
jgi:hypothetical protein